MKVTYIALSTAFADVKNKTVQEIGRIIGGMVEVNVNSGDFKNACALRLSYALNKAGIWISSKDGAVSSGSDKKKYLYRMNDVEKLVKNRLNYDKILSGTNSSDFDGEQGIIVFKGCGWNDAAGHIDLYDGKKVEGQDYSTKCGKITLYVLP